ncbi:MAG: glycosyltransferase [Ignavibacteriaceae bacterium]|nr:glycosyltransferase [Ignavibacteriaceae bacterium]
MKDKTVLIIFLGNIHYDTRASNLYETFTQKGNRTQVVSFDWLTENFKAERGQVSVYKLKKKSSLLFYLRFSVIISVRLLTAKADMIFAEDIYTLPFAIIFGKLKGAKVFYDSREVYGHLAGLSKRKNIQNLLRWIENLFIRFTFKTITTGELDSKYLEKKYNLKDTIVIRNLPLYDEIKMPFDFRGYYTINEDVKILLYQGVILHGRGLGPLFEVLKGIKNCILIIIGGGEHEQYYKELAIQKGLNDKVFFFGKVMLKDLLYYTAGADIGLCIIENLSLSYYYALPNKLFEYIITGVPVFASNFPQMVNIIDKYKVGEYISPENPIEIKEALQKLIDDKDLRKTFRNNCLKAAMELNWEKEIEKLFSQIEPV